MSELQQTRRIGCAQAIAVGGLLLWLPVVPVGLRLAADLAPASVRTATRLPAALVAGAAVLILVPYLAVGAIARRKPAWHVIASIASACATVGGYVVLDAALQAAAPAGASTVLEGQSLWVSVGWLALMLLYALLTVRAIPRLVTASSRPLAWRPGVGHHVLRGLPLALAAAALVTLAWPVTGSLGDSLTSLRILLQAIATVLPEVLLVWGAVFPVLIGALPRPRIAVMVAVFLHGFAALGPVLAGDNWGELGEVLLRLPLGLLISDLLLGGGGIVAPLALAYVDRTVPLLFVDPRDAILAGIPEPQHIAARGVSLVTMIALVLGARIWKRLWPEMRRRWQGLKPVPRAAALPLAVGAWFLWGGLYAALGVPGFANHGFLIILEEQADLGLTAAPSDRELRLAHVYQTLVDTAESSQGSLRAELDALSLPYRPYYLINMIRVDGHRWLMARFEGRPGVAQVLLNPNVRTYPRRVEFPYGDSLEQFETVQANLKAVRADGAWALGVTGEGIVVAGQDTGYDWSHPALKTHYRGHSGQGVEHSYNWHDAWDATAVPFDDGTHGTHTMGIVLGDDGMGNRTGMAPAAKWIGCRNMRRGLGNPASYVECMEFFLAPYPHGGDPFRDGDVSMAPHVTNNSWACPDVEGCLPGTLKRAVDVIRFAGIMMVVSAGNEGPACATLSIPPAIYGSAFSVGATNDEAIIEPFSSRGPADTLIKPDIAAPGGYVRSSVAGGGYGYAGGTSMAGPHVAGLVALLWSANPALVGDIDGTEMLICRTAVPRPVGNVCADPGSGAGGLLDELVWSPVCACGDTTGVPNNVYGCGFIDAEAAVREAGGP